MAKTKVTWLTLGPEPHMAMCQRCGYCEPKPDLPLSIDAFKYCEYITAKHEHCLPGSQLPLEVR